MAILFLVLMIFGLVFGITFLASGVYTKNKKMFIRSAVLFVLSVVSYFLWRYFLHS